MVFPLWPLSSIVGVVLGIVSMKQVRQRPMERGFGLAVAGVVIGVVVLVALAIVIAVLLYFDHACRNGC